MRYKCKFHDIVLCERHKEDCLEDNCKLEPLDVETSIYCSVCDGIISAKQKEA